MPATRADAVRVLARRQAGQARRAVHYARATRGLARDLGDRGRRRGPGQPPAVAVVHAFYEPELGDILQRLEAVRDHLDVVVTTPAGALPEGTPAALRSDGHVVVEVPNLGRDVLPFVRVLPVLARAGYVHVLKLHTKRSPHADGGRAWLTGLLDELVGSPQVAQAARAALAAPDAGVVGPARFYYSLDTVYAANAAELAAGLVDAVGAAAARQAIADRHRLGFFAGTMFWARVDALTGIADSRLRRYAAERGQIDGTYPHALERLFTVVPRLRGRQIFGIDHPSTPADPADPAGSRGPGSSSAPSSAGAALSVESPAGPVRVRLQPAAATVVPGWLVDGPADPPPGEPAPTEPERR